jgi:hypothetical protein
MISKTQQKRFAEILKKVRLSILEFETERAYVFVCHEIRRVSGISQDSFALQRYIQKSLKGNETVGSWLEKFHPEFYYSEYRYDNIGYRLAWIRTRRRMMSTQKFKAGDVIRLKKEQKDDYAASRLANRDLVVVRANHLYVYFEQHSSMTDGWVHERFEYASKHEVKPKEEKPIQPKMQSQKNYAWAIVDKADKVRYITTTRKSARELKAMLSTRFLKIRKIEFSFTDQKDKS